jgi:alkylation response protein AidB-like acyl-CoA dehydrogenase
MDLILERGPSMSNVKQSDVYASDALSALPPPAPSSVERLAAFRRLVDTGPDLPLPARGHTLWRWRFLARVASRDLVVVKLFEAHADALAILADLDSEATIVRLAEEQCGRSPAWAVWAAEPPEARLRGYHDDAGGLRLSGRKAWCSGAAAVTHALVTYRTEDDRPALAHVDVNAEGIDVTNEGWHAVGMADTGSVDVHFDDVRARAVGLPGAYLDRPGFWHGGAGIAACWYGGALPLADALLSKVVTRADPHALAHLGRIDYSLRQTRALMHETARAIDNNAPASNRDTGSLVARTQTLRLRAAVESTVALVLTAFGNALGAAPLCRDASLAHRYADLPVFLRQSHAERDLAELGRLLTLDTHEEEKWRV